MHNPYKTRVECPIRYCDYISRTHIVFAINEICVTPKKREWNVLLSLTQEHRFLESYIL
jgi:hypothetical protein